MLLLIVSSSVAALSLLGSLWMILGIGLLFLPAVFASTQYLAASFSGKSVETSYITRAFGGYFRLPSLGVYRFLFNALLAFVSTLGVGMAFVMAYYLIASAVDPSFASAAESISTAMRAGDYETALAAFDGNGVFANMYNVSEIVLGFALVFFTWLYFGHYAQNAIVRNAFGFNNPRLSNYFYRYYRHAVKRDWIKQRWPFLFFPIAFLLLGGGVSALCYRFGMKSNLSTFIGLLSFSFLYSVYLPLGLYLHASFAFDHESSVKVAYYEGSRKIYDTFASSGRASEEDLAKMRDELEKMRPPHDESENE